METCEMSFIKYVLFIFNLFFAISGIGIIVAGAIVLADVTDFDHFLDGKYLAPPIILIVVGVIIFIVAFLGCFGAIQESYSLLITYAVCLILIFVLELAVGIAAAVYKSDFQGALHWTLRQSLDSYYTSDIERMAWDNAQTKLQCCGIYSPNDWQGQKLPYSCCHNNEDFASPLSQYCLNEARGKYMFEIGCYDKVAMKINNNLKVLIGVGLGIAFVQLTGVVLAFWLACKIRSEEDEEVVTTEKS